MRAAAGPSLQPLPARPGVRGRPGRLGCPGVPAGADPGPHPPRVRPEPALCGGWTAASSLVCVAGRSRQPPAREAPASYCKPRFPRASSVGHFGVVSRRAQVYNLALWIPWAAELRTRFCVSRSWKDAEFVCSDSQGSRICAFGKSDCVAGLSESQQRRAWM